MKKRKLTIHISSFSALRSDLTILVTKKASENSLASIMHQLASLTKQLRRFLQRLKLQKLADLFYRLVYFMDV